MPGADPHRSDGPLFAWGEALRAARTHHRRLRRRAALAAVPALCALATTVVSPSPRLVWNASPSMPIGLYRVSPGTPAGIGELVVARVPAAIRALAARRRYLPATVPLVKQVAAVPGDEVCALGPRLFVNGRPSITRRLADRHGRPLPWWSGCVRLREGRRLLLAPDNPDSFDGRYFGVSEPQDILGKARLLWAKPQGTGQMSRRFRNAGCRVLGLVLLLAPLSARAFPAVDPVDPWRGFAGEASLRFGVPSDWIVAVMRAESGGHIARDGHPIRSSKGAIGLMQLMPATWAEMHMRLDLGSDPDDPHDNIFAGAAYLRVMYDRFGYPGLFAAYNMGPARYAAYLRGEARLPAETIAYLAQVTGGAGAAPRVTQAAANAAASKPGDLLFAVRVTAPAGSETAPIAAPTPSLFAIRHDGE